MGILPWIKDKDLELAVSFLLDKAKDAKRNSERQFGKNVIDPFSAIFEMAGFEIDFQTWHDSETTRQAQKTLQNHVGEFHQNILGSIAGWQNMHTGNVIDLVSKKNKIVAEVKNKYNTVSGGKLADLYYSLDGIVMPKSSIYKGYTAYYVAIIPKQSNPFDKEFTPSDKSKGKKCAPNPFIREIDGASFYDLVTETHGSLEDLFDVLPMVIKKCSHGKYVVKEKEKLKNFFTTAFGKT